MDADGACAESPAKKFRSEDGECASPMDADGTCAESHAKKFRPEDGESASNMDADSACAESLAKKFRSEDGECASPLAASNRPLGNHRSKWRHKPYRADRGQARKPRLAPIPPRLRTESHDLSVARAAAPAKVFRKCEQGQASVSVKTEQCIERLAARLAAGRSIAALTQVMDVHLFSAEKGSSRALSPQKGLFAQHGGVDVFIVSVFDRYRVGRAHVTPVVPDKSGGYFTVSLKNVFTCRQDELDGVGVHFHACRVGASRSNTRLYFRPADSSTQTYHESVMRHLAFTRFKQLPVGDPSEHAIADRGASAAIGMEPRQLLPAALRAHLAVFESRGQRHCACPRSDRKTVGFVLDVPLPLPFDDRGYVCSTCKNDPRVSHCPTYRLDDDDIKHAFPGILVHRHRGGKATYMTTRFLVHVVLSFYEVLNARATRRKLVEYYSSNSLLASAALAWSMAAIPRCKVIRQILLKAFAFFLSDVVEIIQKRLFVYAGQGIRGDGNYDISTRIGVKSTEGHYAVRPYTVLLAWCGVDGCLLKPVVPSGTEAWVDLAADLDGLLDKLRAARLSAGMDATESAPVFHSTDVYRKHRSLIEAFYKQKWPDASIRVDSLTPKGDALSAELLSGGSQPTMAVGEPFHDVIAVRRLCSPASNDCSDMIYDHQDMIDRLSAKLVEEGTDAKPTIHQISVEAGKLLQCAALLPVADFKAELGKASGEEVWELEVFLGQPACVNASAWKQIFNAKPPRGTLARIARRFKFSLHETMQKVNYASPQAFRKEVRRMRTWYRPGRKGTRRRLGIIRDENAPLRVRGRRTVWNKKIAAHYKRLLQPLRQEGLWKWRMVALALHAAGMPVHAGTIPVERLWASMKEMLPDAARLVSLEWFEMLSKLAFMRYNYRHFHHRLLPSWAESDSLIAERLDNICQAARAMHDEESPTGLARLCQPFL
jgi:hypothetical protein